MAETREPWQGDPEPPPQPVRPEPKRLQLPPHPVEGHMDQATANDLYDFFTRRPPTDEEADRLACEELAGKDRKEVFTLLEYFRGRP